MRWALRSQQSGVVIREKDIKLAWGEMREDGYLISLYYSEVGVEATFAAGFGGSTRIEHLSDAHRVELSGGRTGMFMPVSCGGSCAPANLWWEQNGVMYQITPLAPPLVLRPHRPRFVPRYPLRICWLARQSQPVPGHGICSFQAL